MVPLRFQSKKLAEGTEVHYRYTAPVPALAPNFKDAASYNVQYLDVDQGLSSSYVMNIVEDSAAIFGLQTGPQAYRCMMESHLFTLLNKMVY
ncbi:MAG: hypothetical protein IPG07_15955 [Crocinitomicaceae bacterium]|nr:hypothetical protein [Crocinitomicaceae bacterium]